MLKEGPVLSVLNSWKAQGMSAIWSRYHRGAQKCDSAGSNAVNNFLQLIIKLKLTSSTFSLVVPFNPIFFYLSGHPWRSPQHFIFMDGTGVFFALRIVGIQCLKKISYDGLGQKSKVIVISFCTNNFSLLKFLLFTLVWWKIFYLCIFAFTYNIQNTWHLFFFFSLCFCWS